MKKIILLSLTLLFSSLCLYAQKTIYVVDNVTVDNFNGSQLIGKTIKDYKITTQGRGNKAITVHAITTAPSVISISGDVSRIDFPSISDLDRQRIKEAVDSVKESVSVRFYGVSPEKILYIIDGMRTEDMNPLRTLSPSQIKSIEVLKDKDSLEKYGVSFPVMVVTTKNPEASLKELLKNIPGVKVDKDGSVSLNGKTVNQIVVKGDTYELK